MSKCEPWHSPAENVHHAWDDCASARRTTRRDGAHRSGTGDRPLCAECAQLMSAAAAVQRVREARPPAERRNLRTWRQLVTQVLARARRVFPSRPRSTAPAAARTGKPRRKRTGGRARGHVAHVIA